MSKQEFFKKVKGKKIRWAGKDSQFNEDDYFIPRALHKIEKDHFLMLGEGHCNKIILPAPLPIWGVCSGFEADEEGSKWIFVE